MQQQRIAKINYTDLRLIGRAIVTGILTGLVVSAFRWLIQHELQLVMKAFRYFHQEPLWLIPWVIGSIILALILGYVSQRYPDIQGSGIPQVEGQLTGQFDEKWWPVLWRKFVVGVLAIGTGLFLGREGPSIQLGAAVGQGFSESRHHEGISRRVQIASGAAAGLSAAFNAPIASSMFVLEEVYHNFSPLVWLSVFISALSANGVSMAIFGLTPDLDVPHETLFPINQYWLLIVLGLVLGILGRFYQYVILSLPRWSKKLTWIKPQYYPVIPFLLVIPIAWFWPITLGGGNQLIVALPQMGWSLTVVIGVFVLRFVFSMISYGSQVAGGIFLPILTLGGIIGAAFCLVMVKLGLVPAHYLANYVIYAMAGYFACISKAPFTAILLITEMVGTMTHLMPLAVVSITAYVMVDLLGGRPVYSEMLKAFLGKDESEDDLTGMTQMTTSIYAGSQLDGCRVKDFDWPQGSLVMAVYRGDDQLVPHGNTRLQVGDVIAVQLTGKDHLQEQQRIKQAAHQ